MLFEAALLVSSAVMTTAVGASAMPQNVGYSISYVQDTPSAVDAETSTSAAAVDPAALPTLRGLSLLQQLSLMPSDSLAEFVANNSDVMADFLASQPSAQDVSQWWATTGIESRSTFLDVAPTLVGNLDGVPFGQRDYANRRSLVQAESSLASLVSNSSESRSQLVDATHTQHMLEQVADALVAPKGAPARTLLSLDTAGAGTASIVIGDLATADYVSFLVPGMFYTVDGQLVDWTTSAQTLYDTQSEWIAQLGGADPSLADASVATVAWLGYETPSMVNFTSLDLAYEGRDAIAATVNGVRELRATDQPFLTLVAHSYGSTASMMALTDLGIDIDALAVVGSPGSSAQSVADLNVPGDNVYVGEAAWDQIKDSAFFGSDPGSDSFGAHVFSVDGGTDPLTGQPLGGSTGHNEYFTPGCESMRNLALIALGRGYLITTDDAGSTVARGFTGVR